MEFTGQLCAALETEEFRNKTPQEQLEHLKSVSDGDEVVKKMEKVNRLRNEYGYIDEDISEKDQRKYDLDQVMKKMTAPLYPDAPPTPTPAVPGSFDALNPEIWGRIVGFLVPAAPKPPSGMTKQEYSYLANNRLGAMQELYKSLPDTSEAGTTKRRDIRAGDLAVLMRTSLAFNFQAARHLYTHVITDDLPCLAFAADFPAAHPEIESKNQLLRRIKTLRLEYGQKEDDTSYYAIMLEPLKFTVLGVLNREVDALQVGAAEAVRIGVCLEKLQGKRTRFPALTHLAVGSIFGGDEPLWSTIVDPRSGFAHFSSARGGKKQPSIAELVAMCQQSVMLLFRACPLLHVCQRSYSGPLSLPAAFDWDDSFPGTHSTQSARHLGKIPRKKLLPAATIPLFTMHLGTDGDGNVRASPNHPTRWLLENSDRNRFTMNLLVRNFLRVLDTYHETVQNAGFKDYKFDINIYISSNRYTPARGKFEWPADPRTILRCKPSTEADTLDIIRKHSEKQLRSEGMPEVKGISSWRPSTESPVCEACGWEFEEIA